MKTLLSLLTISTLSIAITPISVNSALSTHLNKSVIQTTDDPFINKTNNLAGYSFSTPNGNIYVDTLDCLYKSTNNGIIFNKISDLRQINNMAVSSIGDIYAASYSGLYKSTDGDNFTKISDLNYIYTVNIASNGDIYAASDSGLYKSTDGDKFTKINDLAFTTGKAILIQSNGDIYVGGSGNENKGGLYKSTNNGVTFNCVTNDVNDVEEIVVSNNIMYIGTKEGLYKSTNGNNFSKISDLGNDCVFSIAISTNQTIYVGCKKGLYALVDDGSNIFNKITDLNTYFIFFIRETTFFVANSGHTLDGLYKIDLIDNLLTLKTPHYVGNKYHDLLYKQQQMIDLKETYLKSATLDKNTLTIPSQNIPISLGKHTLVLIVKDEYQKYLEIFGGNINTGQITYNFWIKTSIDPINELNFKTTTSDTDLLTGLISNVGNTNNSPIIQTRAKQGTGIHSTTLIINLNSDMFDLDKSYYIPGIVDNNNNFSEVGTRVKSLMISMDGTYHLHLVDVVGNTYDSYLELGKSNWKLKGTFNDQQLNDLSNKLNVTVNLTDPTKKQEAMGWLHNYQSDADKLLNNNVSFKGKGFNIDINDLIQGYQEFLDPINYTDITTKENINQDKLDEVITSIANKKLRDDLLSLPQDLNVDTSYVVNKATLDNYSNWIKNYQQFINKNKDQWINDLVNIVARDFATQQEIQDIKSYLTNLKFSKFIKQVVYLPNYNLATSNDYHQFIELDKLKAHILSWVNNNYPDINQAYQNAINQAESKLNLHGYSIDKLLDDKSKPQTKNEINSFIDGQSYHNFLQSQADSMFRVWQLKMGLSISMSLVIVTVGVSVFLYWRFNKKNQPYSEKISKD